MPEKRETERRGITTEIKTLDDLIKTSSFGVGKKGLIKTTFVSD